MGFGNFIRGIVAQANPFDNGKTYGSYNPPKKKPEPGDPGYVAPAPQASSPAQQNISQNTPQIQRPQNLFAGLRNNLALPTSTNTAVPVHSNPSTTPSPTLPPGTVVKPTVKPIVTAPNITHIGQLTPSSQQINAGATKYTAQNEPTRFKAIDTGADVTANVASGFAEGLSKLAAAPLSLASLIARKTGHIDHANAIDRINLPSKIGNSIAGARKEVDVSAQQEGVNTPYQVGARIGSTVLAIPALAEGLSKLGQIPSVIKNVPRTAAALRTAGKVGGGELLPKVRQFFRGNPAEDTTAEAAATGEVGNVLPEAVNTTQIPVGTGIDVNAPPSRPTSIPVRVAPRPIGQPIIEVGGDTPGQVRIPTSNEAAAQKAADNFNNQVPGRPDQNIEGVTPRTTQPFKLADTTVQASKDDLINQYADFLRSVGEGNGVAITSDGRRVSNNVRFGETGGKQMSKAAWRDEAQRQLEAGSADPSIQKVFDEAGNPDVQSLLHKGEQAPAPEGRPIAVKQVNSIPVQDKTVVPTGLPETPGTVRATTQTSPMVAKTEAVANTPVVASPAQLPAEVQTILDNPKQFSKRQVAAARNQRKLARQLSKVKSDTKDTIDNMPDLAPKPEGSPGFVPTGEFRRGENGNVTEVAHGNVEAAQGAVDTANLSSGDVLTKASQEIAQGGRVSPESVRNLQAMLDSGRFAQTSPEYRAMAKTLYGAGSDYGRGLSLFNPTLRRTASGDQLTNRFVSKLYGVVEDGSKLTDSHIEAVSRAEGGFAAARDAANQAIDRYNATKSATDFAAWKQARQAADDAEKHALITEYKVANEVLKGNRDPAALKAVQDAEKKAGVYQMDWIDANMLSGSGTATRNLTNTALVRLENRMFGGRAYSSAGAKIGNKVGNRSVVTDFKARNELDQNALPKTVKQWSTTANTLGEGNINAVGSARAYKYYADQLKAQGVTGDQLKRDTEVMLHSDPEGMADRYNQWALSENALSGLAHSKKIEQTLVDAIASKGGGKLSQTAAKAVVRLTVGFPTVIGRSLLGGVKRATLGVPDLIAAGRQFAKGDTQAMKDALYAAKVHAGSGAMLYALGTGLAEAGIISPSYPSDPAEQARWKSEGRQPNSIRIGGNWFSIPGYFGALALPLTIPANIIDKTTPGDIAKGVISGVQDLAPTAGIVNFINGMEGKGGKQWIKNEITSLTRAFTPAGALLAEIAKMTDPTKNDTTTKDAISNLLDSIASGIPGVNNAVNKIAATDDNGNILHNPAAAATFFGAQGTVEGQGAKDVQAAQSAANDTYKQLNDYGVLKDKNLMGLVDKKTQAQIERGQALTPEELTKVQKAVVKGVSATGEDTAYLEKGQYDTNLAALKVKRDLMNADPTTKPTDLTKMDTAIKRGQVYKDNKLPYDMISAYESTSVSDWRKMGTPPSDKNYDPDLYNPDMYQKLYDIDQLMTKAGVSYRKDAMDKNKYYTEQKKAGGAGGRGGYSSDFGKLSAGSFAPSVKQYQSIDVKSGSIPHIAVQRPNIVHSISSSGGI